MLDSLQLSFIFIVASSIASLLSLRWISGGKLLSTLLSLLSGFCALFAGCKVLFFNLSVTYKLHSIFPYIAMQFRLDPLAGFFLCLLGIIVCCASIYSIGYLREITDNKKIVRILCFTGLFIAGMYLVVIAADIFSFMFGWEIMSLSSYFLVITNHEDESSRRAALLYLIMAHASGLCILFGYGILAKFSGSFSFAAMHLANLSQSWKSLAFLLAFVGFGMKAGLFPLHIWLPEAHPVAPSHISALMSGVMLKIAIYGFIRFVYYLLGYSSWHYGVVVLLVGSLSAIFGVLYALMQNDVKKLLAYSSIDNLGIVFIALGLSMIFMGTGHAMLGALGLLAALYHCLSHSIFKSLLFFGAGAILQQTGEHDMEKLGGLIRGMPLTAIFFLVGCLSIAALPPFNGFVSEWLIFQAALQSTLLSHGVLGIIVPIAAALLALTSILVATAFVKLYGISFLGQPRSLSAKNAVDPHFTMLLAMSILAVLCLLFGIFPSFVINVINAIPINLIGVGLGGTQHWLWLVPMDKQVASYGASSILLSVIIVILLINIMLWLFSKSRIKTVANPWECGFGAINARMQYTATAFAMPLRRVFSGVWLVRESVDKNVKSLKYSLEINDWLIQYFYQPLAAIVAFVTQRLAVIQGGNIRVYLIYIFVTLVVLLWIVS